MPIVIPNNERKVLNLLTITELSANKNPSLSNLKNILKYFESKDEKFRMCNRRKEKFRR